MKSTCESQQKERLVMSKDYNKLSNREQINLEREARKK